MRWLQANPTFVGIFAVFVWGFSLPLVKFVQGQIGILAWPAITFTAIGFLGLLNNIRRKQPLPSRDVFENPYLYGRWFFFVASMACLWVAIGFVSKQFMPFVILLNYLWPTFIILCSIFFAGVKVTRPVVFCIGTLVVIIAIAIEVLNPDVLTIELFAQSHDRIAYLFTVISALSWGIYSALSKRAGDQTGGSSVLPFFQLNIGLIALPLSFVPGWVDWNHMTLTLVGIFFVWCILYFFAYLTWDFGMRQGNVVILSLFADFTPWLSLLASHIILNIDIGQKTIISAVFLVIGAMTTRYGTLVKKSASELNG